MQLLIFFILDLLNRTTLDFYMDGVPFNSISHGQREQMTVPFFDQEIKEAVWSCGGDKCPGPDGLNFNFIKTKLGCVESRV